MRKTTVALAMVGALGASAAGGMAFAGAGETNDVAAPARAAALGGVKAPNARLAVVVLPDGSVLRSKGVASVGHPSPGVYCIKPQAGTKINVNNIVPSVSVEWSNSSGDALMAQWRSSGGGCPTPGRINIVTFNGEDGSFDADDTVAFTVVVP